MVADAVLVAHFAFVLFIVAGFVLILAGGPLGWRWVRGRAFRIAHLAAIAFVALESLAGIACPLTVLEDFLRGAQTRSSFVARWVAALLYYDLPAWVFTVVYVAFAALVALAWKWIPPAARSAAPGVSSGA